MVAWDGPQLNFASDDSPECLRFVEDLLIEFATPFDAESVVIGHEIIGIFQGDCAVEISEEDDLGIVFEGIWERHGRTDEGSIARRKSTGYCGRKERIDSG